MSLFINPEMLRLVATLPSQYREFGAAELWQERAGLAGRSSSKREIG